MPEAQRRRPMRKEWWSPFLVTVLLTPALLQPIQCGTGDTTLTTLAVEVAGDDMIADFLPMTRTYDVATGADSVVVRAETSDPAALVMYRLKVGSTLLEADAMGTGGGEITLAIPFGDSVLNVDVTAPEGRTGRYTVRLVRFPRFPCTERGIRDAIAYGGGPLTFHCNGTTTVVAQAEIVVDNDVSLDGEGDLTVQGRGGQRIFLVPAGVTAELIGMQLTNGSADIGGGLHNQGSTTLIDVRIASNEASQRGGAIYSGPGSELILEGVVLDDNTAAGTSEAAGGAIYIEQGTALIRNSVVENNVARGWSGQSARRARGGGVFVSEGELVVEASRIGANSAIGGDASGELNVAGYCRGGGLHFVSSTAVIVDSAVSGNVCRGGFAQRGGGFASGGGVWSEGGSLTVEGTTIDNNVAEGVSGPWEVGAGGGLLLSRDARFVAVNSTISGNRAEFGEAMEMGLGASAAVYSSTIAFNSTDESHSALSIRSDSEFTLSHTIFANVGRCFGSVRSLGYNVFGPNFGCLIEGDTTGNQSDVDPQLQPLADNGGPTMTHAISETSPALDAGDPAGCVGDDGVALTSDQRGATRPVGVCDIGAFERQ